ncbi:MAG: hypothetical protein PHX78_10265 [bacterium]|nr:hypothetical protein [bacterium]
MKKILCTIIIISFFKLSFTVAADISNHSDEALIYSIYFNAFIEQKTKHNKEPKEKPVLIIKDKTEMDIPIDTSGKNKYKDEKNHFTFLSVFFEKFKIVNILPDTFKDFWKRNQESSTLNCVIPIENEYIFLTEELENQILLSGDSTSIFSEKLYNRFPSAQLLGVTTLSRVGFNQDKTQALLYAGFMIGPTSGAGYYILYEKKNNIWKEIGRFMCWIS